VVSGKRPAPRPDGEWVTLREAAEATGIPVNTLRKWCRKEDVASYLESDGDLTLRIVDLTTIRSHATALGRTTAGTGPASASQPEATAEPVPAPGPDVEREAVDAGPQTMIVPVDAWNKMLNQLGNLHEAGQQLAEARERAARAETEALFLRERLAELRATPTPAPTPPQPAVTADAPEPTGDPVVAPEEPSGTDTDQPATTSFFRYVVQGWRGRKR